MAYKFQIGAAVLSGSIKAEDGLVATDVDDTTAANIVAQIDNGEIPFAKLASLTSGQILVGNASNQPAAVAMSGDIGISNAGLTTIQAGAVDNAMLAGSIADSKLNTISTAGKVDIGALEIDGASEMGAALVDADLFIVDDGANGTEKSMLASRIPTYVFSKVSGDATIASGGALTIAAGAVENSMLADDAVGADELAPNAVVNASVATGAAIAANKIDFNVDLGGSINFGNQANDIVTFGGGVTVAGDLTVQGTTTSISSTTINISSSFTFEGPADAHETILSCATPGADTTLNLPTLGAGTYFIPALADAATDASAAVTAAEFALLDGGTARQTPTLLDNDGFLCNDGGTMKQVEVVKIIDLAFSKVSGDATIASGGALTIGAAAVEGSMLNNNVISGQTDIGAAIVGTDELLISDNGTIRRTDMSRLKTYVGTGIAAINAIGDANATLAVGVNATTDNASTPRTWTLPASAGLSPGESVIIKAYANSGTHPVTIAGAGSQNIDDPSTTQIVLESDNAAVTLYYVDTDFWIII